MIFTNSLEAANLQRPITDYKKQLKQQCAHKWIALALIFPNIYSLFWHPTWSVQTRMQYMKLKWKSQTLRSCKSSKSDYRLQKAIEATICTWMDGPSTHLAEYVEFILAHWNLLPIWGVQTRMWYLKMKWKSRIL